MAITALTLSALAVTALAVTALTLSALAVTALTLSALAVTALALSTLTVAAIFIDTIAFDTLLIVVSARLCCTAGDFVLRRRDGAVFTSVKSEHCCCQTEAESKLFLVHFISPLVWEDPVLDTVVHATPFTI